jgi:SAM-dependent methyltransferase
MSWQQRYLARYYGHAGWVDGTTEFHALCRSAVPAAGRILEIGAGPSNPTSRFLATLGPLDGLDPDPDVRGNDALARSFVLEGDAFPFVDSSYDACVSNYVLEHVPRPEAHLREVARVLRPGGAYVVRTPNRRHYAPLVASLTPHAVHRLLANRLRGLSAGAHDPYPTVYAMNTRGALTRGARAAGLSIETLRLVENCASWRRSRCTVSTRARCS